VSAIVGEGAVERPAGPWTPAVHALLMHFENVGFDGTPRALGVRDGVEVLSYVEGERSYDPADSIVCEIGALVRRTHDAQHGFAAPPDARWQALPSAVPGDEVVCHNDLLGANVLFRDDQPAVFIYDLERRDGFLDAVGAVWRSWYEAFRPWGGIERRRGSRRVARGRR